MSTNPASAMKLHSEPSWRNVFLVLHTEWYICHEHTSLGCYNDKLYAHGQSPKLKYFQSECLRIKSKFQVHILWEQKDKLMDLLSKLRHHLLDLEPPTSELLQLIYITTIEITMLLIFQKYENEHHLQLDHYNQTFGSR